MKFVWRVVLTLSAWVSLGVHVWLNDMAIEPIPPGEYFALKLPYVSRKS